MGRRALGLGGLGAVIVIGAGIVVLAAAPVTSVEGPATATRPANRGTPVGGPAPTVGGCSIFPAANAWNTDISAFPLHPSSNAIIARLTGSLHPDFGGDGEYGIPFVVVPQNQPLVPITYTAYGDESDPGPFPIPLQAPVEGGSESDGDRHVIALRQGTCDLFELYRAFRAGSGWEADSGAKWDLTTGALRPLGWTSADAAGLPILPGLVRYDEVVAGEIRHAIRVTFSQTYRGFILPATHFASRSSDASLPPMGLRIRLKSSYDISRLTGQAKVIATALQRYGFIVADNGSNWFFQGAQDVRWNDDELNQLKSVPGSAFEVVDTGDVQDG